MQGWLYSGGQVGLPNFKLQFLLTDYVYILDMSPADTARFSAAFTSLDSLILRFIQEIPSIQSMGEHGARPMLVVHTLVHIATIQLHSPFIVQNSISHARFISSAQSVVQIINAFDLEHATFLDPIISVSPEDLLPDLRSRLTLSTTDVMGDYMSRIYNRDFASARKSWLLPRYAG